MSNHSISWWLKQVGLPQYRDILETQYYGLEGLQGATDQDLREVGVEDPSHRSAILTQLGLHTHTGGVQHRGTRKGSLGSASNLVKSRKDLFRQSVLPRLRRLDKVTLSTSFNHIRPPGEGLVGEGSVGEEPVGEEPVGDEPAPAQGQEVKHRY